MRKHAPIITAALLLTVLTACTPSTQPQSTPESSPTQSAPEAEPTSSRAEQEQAITQYEVILNENRHSLDQIAQDHTRCALIQATYDPNNVTEKAEALACLMSRTAASIQAETVLHEWAELNKTTPPPEIFKPRLRALIDLLVPIWKADIAENCKDQDPSQQQCANAITSTAPAFLRLESALEDWPN